MHPTFGSKAGNGFLIRKRKGLCSSFFYSNTTGTDVSLKKTVEKTKKRMNMKTRVGEPAPRSADGDLFRRSGRREIKDCILRLEATPETVFLFGKGRAYALPFLFKHDKDRRIRKKDG